MAEALEGLVLHAETGDETEEQIQGRLGALGAQLWNREGLEVLLRSAAAQAGGADAGLRTAALRAVDTILRLREKLAALRQQKRQKRRFQEGQVVARMQAQEMAAALQAGYALGSAPKAVGKAPPGSAGRGAPQGGAGSPPGGAGPGKGGSRSGFGGSGSGAQEGAQAPAASGGAAGGAAGRKAPGVPPGSGGRQAGPARSGGGI